ncbi:Fc.00g043610.m01.CDS01 [Cosmosporella sp. VM-42]
MSFKTFTYLALALAFAVLASIQEADATQTSCRNITYDLRPLLSKGASVTTNISAVPRWSDYHAPHPLYMVNVAEELDVAKTVKYCNEHGIKFLAQSGGNGWATTFHLGDCGIIINLRSLNTVILNEGKDKIHIGGGTTFGELVDAAYVHDVQALNGGCNCVGVLGAVLGGGLSRWMNFYGMPVDNVVSANIVTADGELRHISKTSHPDLFWAILGAGPNFGIVTSIAMNAFPLLNEGRLWTGELLFSRDKLEEFISAANNLDLNENMTLLWGFGYRPEPVITAQITWMTGDEEAGREAFEAFYDLEPDEDTTQIVYYNHMNDDTTTLCEKGGRKPGWSTGLKTYDYSAWKGIWELFTDFVDSTGLTSTTIMVECYSSYVLREIGSEGASYAHRDVNGFAWLLFDYEDVASDAASDQLGSSVRELWRQSSGFNPQKTYLNFAHGDESPEEIYGESLARLTLLKREWDPQGVFDQWFPIE